MDVEFSFRTGNYGVVSDGLVMGIFFGYFFTGLFVRAFSEGVVSEQAFYEGEGF